MTAAHHMYRHVCRSVAATLLVTLAACTSAPPSKPSGPLLREQSRWVPVAWQDLPGWSTDSQQAAWPALVVSCQRPLQEWTHLCATLQQAPPRNEAQARAWLTQHLQPYRVESLEGTAHGLITGYYEPSIEARRAPGGAFRVALYAPPADLAKRRPYWTRQQLDTLPAAQASLRGREIAYVADPLDALVLQIQGSGRLRITEQDGSVRTVRVAFAGHNDQPYKSVGRWLIEQGELQAGQASWPAIKDWAQRHPARRNELLWANPRYVFFREEPLPNPAVGPRGAMGVPLTPGRSIAVDPRSVPYGTPVWIDTTEPLASTPLRRLVLAQDTGSAIVGAVRADYFWGWDGDAAEQAGRMRQPLRMWVLWPRGT
jgi:membrane-bound lytic murein transglycosylase A